MNKFDMYLINYTNMHVGSGDNGGKITINEYAKDFYNNAPIIPASGLKGSLRHNFEMTNPNDSKEINAIFGGLNTDNETMQMADLVFTNANTVFYPVRTNEKSCDEAFIYVTTASLLMENNMSDNLLESPVAKYIKSSKCDSIKPGSYIENLEVQKKLNFEEGTKVLIIEDSMFNLIMQMAPVVTRNKVANGDKDDSNVWSEEIVPRYTILKTSIFSETNVTSKVKEGLLKSKLESLNTTKVHEMLQIGGNASIGMGYCRVIASEE